MYPKPYVVKLAEIGGWGEPSRGNYSNGCERGNDEHGIGDNNKGGMGLIIRVGGV